ANSQLFLGELCDLLDVPRPEPTRQNDADNVYVFEKVVEINNGDGTTTLGRIDLYRQGAFVLESKQGSERKLAEALPDEWPPLLIVCDVGFCLDLYADFARTG